MNVSAKRLGAFLIALCMIAPSFSYAATKTTTKKVTMKRPAPLEIGGWVPYWRMATGTADVLSHVDQLTSVMPFGYTMKQDGAIYDAMNYASSTSLQALIAVAKSDKVRVVPTIMWSNGDAIHATLSSAKKRRALEDNIVALVKQNNFDGIDIDFEGKKAETKPYFSLFLKGLSQRLGSKKWLYCAVEARTPVADRYSGTPPADATQYANDYAAIGKYCDRVEIMAYDQGTIDVNLNAAADGTPYIPVADTAWVKKVVALTAKSIPKNKIVIGVATYGYEYEVTKLSEYGFRYDLQWALNPKYATDLASSLNIVPTRNAAGELSFTYTPTTTNSTAPLPAGVNVADVAMASTSYSDGATTTAPNAAPVNIVWWSDASAIKDKIDLARSLGVRGVSIFKLDGGEDPNIWNILK
ncbi:MAG TPA: glycosyl hydrolase family 18 protein [Candidatus Paceibacterota bacterium]